MNDLIQTIKVLNKEELKIINDYIDELSFTENLIFSSNGETKIDTSVRSSLGTTMNEEHEATKLLHQKINESLLTYKEQVILISEIFQYESITYILSYKFILTLLSTGIGYLFLFYSKMSY